MAIPEAVIKEAVARYERERDRYLKLAARVADICRVEIVEGNAIRAQVTSRAKSRKSFEAKLRRFSNRPDKDMPTVDSVFQQIGDLAGVRVATYRPEDQARVVSDICKLFFGDEKPEVLVDTKDRLKEGGFYRATHCQVSLTDDDLVGTYENLRGTSCEVQICSMMAHVFNEVEHDIAYKPEGGGPQDAEKGLLEGLGHLTRTGDNMISQILAANEARLTEKPGGFDDPFDFVANLRKEFPGRDLSGYAGQLFDELTLFGIKSIKQLKAAIGVDQFRSDIAEHIADAYNGYTNRHGEAEYKLDINSSDLVLALFLEKYAEQIEKNHPAGRGRGRPPRIRSIATRYLEFKASRGRDAPVA